MNTTTPTPAWKTELTEAFDLLWNSMVDPTEPFHDDGDRPWIQLDARGRNAGTITTPMELDEIRGRCRHLAATNEFAINGHENRISYIVGTGHQYRVIPIELDEYGKTLARQVQELIESFIETNRWHARQQEIVRRKDRDGEAFLRLFFAPEGTTHIRFVEPDQVVTPETKKSDPAASFGILTEPDDVETALGYFIDGRLIDAREIQHRKANVDANVKRGTPLFFPVWKNLARAEKLLRNMSVVSEIQSAIAIIRKHGARSRSTVQQYVQNGADTTATNTATGQTSHYKRYAPGTILDAAAGTDYEFPTMGLDASRYVIVLQAELRAIASRLVMPEFMLTSDASGANYSSSMIAEGPAVKMFGRLQQDMIEDDLKLLRKVIGHAVGTGRLPIDALKSIRIQAVPPVLTVRDRYKDAKADEVLVKNGAMSVATMAMRHSLDPAQEFQSRRENPTREAREAREAVEK